MSATETPAPGAAFAASLTAAEDRLRALGWTGRDAFSALCRSLAGRLGLDPSLWPDGPDAPPEAALDRVPLTADLDLFGLAYERFFPDLFKGARGQFFTPQPVVDLTVALAEVRPGQTVLDPTCGSGAFLAAAARRGAVVAGGELDPELVTLARLHLALVGADPAAVDRADLFRDEPGPPADVILANPPFSVDVTDPAALEGSELAAGRPRVSSDILFLEAAHRRLRPGGRLAAVLPYSLLTNPRFAPARAWLRAHFARRAVVGLPEGVFRPFGGAAGRAAIVVLDKRPAADGPWLAAEVRDPGFDPRRRVFVPTGGDDIRRLLAARAADTAPLAAAEDPLWTPLCLRAGAGIAPDRPRARVDALVARVPGAVRPSDTPAQPFTEIDLADVDKQTGEVAAARARLGAEFKGSKATFEEGEVVFGRIRPALNNVAVVRRPDPALPEALTGSSEWLRLRPHTQPGFALLALRSPFVRAQLRDTGGQTRPRIRGADLDAVQVPVPGEAARAALDELVQEAHAVRLAARRRLDRAAALYAAWGRGELDEDALVAALKDA